MNQRASVRAGALCFIASLLAACGSSDPGPMLMSIAVTPANISLAHGTTQQFTATGTFDDGTTQNVTTSVSWNSSSTAAATVSNTFGSSGLATAVTPGPATITAASGSISSSATLTVTSANLASIEVTPANPSLPGALTQQFTATGIFSDNTTQNLTTQVGWNSDNNVAATIGNASGSNGLAASVGIGTATISAISGAALGSISGSTILTVTPATLLSISVTPANASIPGGITEQFTATGIFSDNTTQNITTSVTWNSTNTATAAVSNVSGASGLANSMASGSATISATAGSISGSTTLTVTGATLVSIAVTPANPSVPFGLTKQFTATGTFSDNATHDITSLVTWNSSSTAAATISNVSGSSGLASSANVGTTTISAAAGSISGSTTLTVTPATLVSITVTPANSSVSTGTRLQFTATGTFSDATTQDVTTFVTWNSLNLTAATISNAADSNGLASTGPPGITTISAIFKSISGSTLMSVTP